MFPNELYISYNFIPYFLMKELMKKVFLHQNPVSTIHHPSSESKKKYISNLTNQRIIILYIIMKPIFIIFLSFINLTQSASSPTWTKNPLLNSGTCFLILQANINLSTMALQNLHQLLLIRNHLILPSRMLLELSYVGIV